MKIPEFPPSGAAVLGTVQVWGAEMTQMSTYFHIPHSGKQDCEFTCLLVLEMRQRRMQGWTGPSWRGMGATPWQDNTAKSKCLYEIPYFMCVSML